MFWLLNVFGKQRTVCIINVTVSSSIISILDKPKPYFKFLFPKKKNKHIRSDVFYRLIFLAAEIDNSQRREQVRCHPEIHEYHVGGISMRIRILHVQ